MSAQLAAIEARVAILFGAGHATGYGAGRATCGGGMDCAGCADARSAAHEWTAWWRDWERNRLSETELRAQWGDR
jgi:hypothetical protein